MLKKYIVIHLLLLILLINGCGNQLTLHHHNNVAIEEVDDELFSMAMKNFVNEESKDSLLIDLHPPLENSALYQQELAGIIDARKVEAEKWDITIIDDIKDYESCNFFQGLMPPPPNKEADTTVTEQCKPWVGKKALLFYLPEIVEDQPLTAKVNVIVNGNYGQEFFELTFNKNNEQWKLVDIKRTGAIYE